MLEFDKDGNFIPKSLKKIIKRENDEAFDKNDLFNDDILVNYEAD